MPRTFDDIACHAKCYMKWKVIVDLKKALTDSKEILQIEYALSSSFCATKDAAKRLYDNTILQRFALVMIH